MPCVVLNTRRWRYQSGTLFVICEGNMKELYDIVRLSRCLAHGKLILSYNSTSVCWYLYQHYTNCVLNTLCFNNNIDIMYFLCNSENHWCFQTQERRTVRQFESKMDKVASQDLLSVLFWSKLFDSKPRIHVRSCGQSGGWETWLTCCSKNQGS